MQVSLGFAALAALAMSACGGTIAASNASAPGDAGDAADAPVGQDAGDASIDGPNACEPLAWPQADGGPPWWADGGCPDAGCPTGLMCVQEAIADGVRPVGCAPTSCGCAVCGTLPCEKSLPVVCDTPTRSQRAVKTDIDYVSDEELDALAREALQIRLARYRYREEPPGARRRLGFLIDDLPDPSPAVQEDRAHVDPYGYASLLLATVQRQNKEIRALEARIEGLEQARARRK